MKKKLVWNIVFLFAAVATGVAFSIKPWQVYGEQRQLADERIAEMRAAEKNRSELMEQRVKLESAAGREAKAREYGFRKSGEQLLPD